LAARNSTPLAGHVRPGQEISPRKIRFIGKDAVLHSGPREMVFTKD
jgi:hypothetical protein